MYKYNVRVFISPPNWRYGVLPHPHLIVVDTFGEGRAGLGPAGNNEYLFAHGSLLSSEGFRENKRRRENSSSVLRQIFGKGGLSN